MVRGPMPKAAELRQRTNKSATRAVLVSDEQPPRRPPRLPKRDEGWHKLTYAWWRDVWRSPMASEYVEADRHALYRLAVIVDRFWRRPSTTLAAEIRMQQQAFGLTPLDRRRLEWSIEQAESASTRRQQRRVRQAHSGEIDPREALRGVK